MKQKIVAIITGTALVLSILFVAAAVYEEQNIEMGPDSLMWFIIVD